MLKYTMLFLVLINGIILAQYYSKFHANIKITLIQGMGVSIINERLKLDEISKIVHPRVSKHKSDGILVQVTGGKNNDFMVDYRYVNFSEFDSIKENKIEQMIGVNPRIHYINDQQHYFLFDNPSPDSGSLINNNSVNKICYVSLVYN